MKQFTTAKRKSWRYRSFSNENNLRKYQPLKQGSYYTNYSLPKFFLYIKQIRNKIQLEKASSNWLLWSAYNPFGFNRLTKNRGKGQTSGKLKKKKQNLIIIPTRGLLLTDTELSQFNQLITVSQHPPFPTCSKYSIPRSGLLQKWEKIKDWTETEG